MYMHRFVIHTRGLVGADSTVNAAARQYRPIPVVAITDTRGGTSRSVSVGDDWFEFNWSAIVAIFNYACSHDDATTVYTVSHVVVDERLVAVQSDDASSQQPLRRSAR
jgi:hypothetical protein